MTQAMEKETFEAFIKSFFYGSRSDLSFKFMSDFNEEQASDFLRNLFRDLVDGLDDRDLAGLKQRIVDGQTAAYSHQKNFDYDEGPFTPLPGPLSDLKLTLLTSSGHFPADRDPKPFGVENMTQAEAEARVIEFLKSAPELSEIPFDSAAGDLRVRHGGYDIRATLKDPNVSFPFQRMTELQEKGTFASLTDNAYSFVGVCSQKKLLENILPSWVETIKRQGTQAAVLVPVWPVCHMSVGHVSRALEQAGIPTVVIAIKSFEVRMKMMSLPRVVLTNELLGRPMGAPLDTARQTEVLEAALDLLRTAEANGAVREI